MTTIKDIKFTPDMSCKSIYNVLELQNVRTSFNADDRHRQHRK